MKKIFFIIFFSFLFSLVIFSQEYEENYINIQRDVYQRIKIYITWDKKVPKSVIKLIKKNFLWSGVFKEQKKAESSIIVHISLDNDSHFISDFFSKNNTLLFQLALKKTSKKSSQEPEIIDFVQKAILELTKKESSLGGAIVYAEKTGTDPTKIVIINTHNTRKLAIVQNKNYNILPKWSPKEDSLIYTSLSKKGSRIYRIELEKKKRKLFIQSQLGAATGGDWNPTNNDLAVTLSNNVNHDLYLFRQNGTLKKKLTRLTAVDTSPVFAPNGKGLVFTSDRSGSVQLYYLNLATNQKNRITFMGNYNSDPDWSHDGTHLLYSGRKNSIFQVYLMDFYGREIKQITYSKSTSEDPSWSPDDRLFIFSSKVSGESKLYVMTVDGEYVRRLTRSPKGVKEFNPDWASSKPWSFFQ